MELGTALAIVAFADQCLKYGDKLVRRCQNYRHAEEEARELLISIEVNWMKTGAQIDFLKQISHSLDPRYRDVQSRVLSELEGKLKTATLTMDQLLSHEENKKMEKEKDKDIEFSTMVKAVGKMALTKKVKYAFKKEALEKIIDDLETWQQRFDPSWMLIMRMASDKIDQQLDQEEKKPKQTEFIMAAKGVRDAARDSTSTPVPDSSIFKSANILSSNKTSILFSSAQHCCLFGTEEHVIVDTMICNPIADIFRTTKDVRKLARILSKVDPITFGLLACQGVVKSSTRNPATTGKVQDFNTFKFIFAIPPALKRPKSLRALLIEGNAACPLNDRLNLAKQLTSSVLFVHSSQFVHKNIRPETIIVFENDSAKIGSSFLVGFEKFRPAEGMTYRISDGIWQNDLYRHPSRQGSQPEEDYQMQHDIYSLGVVLLELGLWQSFVTFSVASASAPSTGVTPAALLTPLLSISGQEKDVAKHAYSVKAVFISLASTHLPAKMGQKYTDVVLLCLQCLDRLPASGIAGFEDGDAVEEVPVERGAEKDEECAVAGNFDDVYDEDGIVVGVRYIEKILLRMQEINI